MFWNHKLLKLAQNFLYPMVPALQINMQYDHSFELNNLPYHRHNRSYTDLRHCLLFLFCSFLLHTKLIWNQEFLLFRSQSKHFDNVWLPFRVWEENLKFLLQGHLECLKEWLYRLFMALLNSHYQTLLIQLTKKNKQRIDFWVFEKMIMSLHFIFNKSLLLILEQLELLLLEVRHLDQALIQVSLNCLKTKDFEFYSSVLFALQTHMISH